MNDSQLMHAMSLDDTYRVEQVLARGEDAITELARRNVWSALTECSSPPPSRGRRHRQRKLHRQLC